MLHTRSNVRVSGSGGKGSVQPHTLFLGEEVDGGVHVLEEAIDGIRDPVIS